MDYLEAIKPRFATIPLDGQPRVIGRAKLGLHYELNTMFGQWQEARRNRNHREAAELTVSYVALATGLDVAEASLIEVMVGFLTLSELNRPLADLPFMRMVGKKDKYQCDYDNRALASWVSRLAAHYHWTSEYILGLTPEEAACYMQEALIHEHEDREFLYRLSEVAYAYDKGSKRARYVQFPKPPWMAKEQVKVKVPGWWMPQGNIIDASNFGQSAGNA